MIACNNDAIETAKVFIEKGSDINSVDAEGMTPIHFAAQAGVNFTKQLEQTTKIGCLFYFFSVTFIKFDLTKF